ncbi:MAG: hypothetical protein HC895_26900 [Leptolyngbyaceae cyanobacterium SM1_3_5]|nr:hypothetical protein [Leptolyngbyaceae cyanobacterium SM1_3_5]
MSDFDDDRAYVSGLEDDRFLTVPLLEDTDYTFSNYFGLIELLGNFNTGSISHQVLVGFDVNRYVQNFENSISRAEIPPLNIFDPDYNISRPELFPNFKFEETIQSYGLLD